MSRSETGSISAVFRELGVLRFISCLSEKEKCELIEYAKSELRPLIDSDRNSGTEYVRTYRTYLYSGGALREMADSLFIHRNTLVKRLGQIEALLRRDIHDPAVKHEDMNVFFVLDYFGVGGSKLH